MCEEPNICITHDETLSQEGEFIPGFAAVDFGFFQIVRTDVVMAELAVPVEELDCDRGIGSVGIYRLSMLPPDRPVFGLYINDTNQYVIPQGRIPFGICNKSDKVAFFERKRQVNVCLTKLIACISTRCDLLI